MVVFLNLKLVCKLLVIFRFVLFLTSRYTKVMFRPESTFLSRSCLFPQTEQRNVIGIQVLSPVETDSTEEIVIYDYKEVTNNKV